MIAFCRTFCAIGEVRGENKNFYQVNSEILTLLRRMEGVIFWHVLYIVLQRCFWQDEPVFVDFVHGILECQLCTAILLVMSEYST